MKDPSSVSQKRKYNSLLEEVAATSGTLDIFGGVSTINPWSTNSSMLGSMPSLLTPWISSHVTAFDDLKLWGHKRLKTAHTPQVCIIIMRILFIHFETFSSSSLCCSPVEAQLSQWFSFVVSYLIETLWRCAKVLSSHCCDPGSIPKHSFRICVQESSLLSL